ncbi:NmrA family NAD(P)-binding protein [Chitinophaga lutea]
MAQTILVFGATGHAGREVVKALAAEKDVTVKAATRHPESYNVPGVAPVLLVQEDPATFAPALQGVDKVFLSVLPLDAGAGKKIAPFFAEAKKAGVRKIVFLSSVGADTLPLHDIEAAVIASGIPYNIIRPNSFMENFTVGAFSQSVRDQHQLMASAGDGKMAIIATEDIAAATVPLLLDDSLQGKIYELSGPEALSYPEIAKLLSDALGRTITYAPVSEEDLITGMTSHGAPESVARYLAGLFRNTKNGIAGVVSTAVQDLSGKAPKRFADFLAANKGFF